MAPPSITFRALTAVPEFYMQTGQTMTVALTVLRYFSASALAALMAAIAEGRLGIASDPLDPLDVRFALGARDDLTAMIVEATAPPRRRPYLRVVS